MRPHRGLAPLADQLGRQPFLQVISAAGLSYIVALERLQRFV